MWRSKDYGFMIQRSFEDLDAYNWEVFIWIRPKMPTEVIYECKQDRG